MTIVRSWALSLLLAGSLAGCNELFPLVPPGDATPIIHDEDHDGISDEVDTCPHLGTGDHTDTDGDGIGAACDPFPQSGNDQFRFYSFVDDFGDLLVGGSMTPDDDAIRFGDVGTQFQSLYLPDLEPADVEIELQYQIVSPTPDDISFHEVAVFAISRGEDTNKRGDICYGGYETGVAGYLQMNEDDSTALAIAQPVAAPAFDVVSTIHLRRTPTDLRCSVQVPGASTTNHFTPNLMEPGRTGVWVSFATVRLMYLWIYIHP